MIKSNFFNKIFIVLISKSQNSSYLLSFTLSLKSGRRGDPSFSQTTFGVGAPVKRHFSFKPVPSVTTTLPLSLGSTTETFGLVAGKYEYNYFQNVLIPTLFKSSLLLFTILVYLCTLET